MKNEGLSISQMHLVFVRILKVRVHSVLMNKSQQPAVKKAKSEAMKIFINEYKSETGVELSEDQVRKRVNNFKSDVKKKTDLKKTGNNPIKLKEWEIIFKDLLSADENPSISCIPGGLSVGADNTNQEETEREVRSTADFPDQTEDLSQDSRVTKQRRLKFDETDETKNLTNVELQRLVLLEQLKLLRMQQKEMEMKINMGKEADNSQSFNSSTTNIVTDSGSTYFNL